MKEAEKPQRRVILERPDRGTITDRFGIPLAINKLQYNAQINYNRIKEIPQFGWEINEEGKKCKIFKRKSYIKELAALVGNELSLDPERVEDLIHGKAAVLGGVPLVIKENISEEEYYRLKMLEREWPGISTERVAKRHYPLGKIGAQIVGYMGAISRAQYEKVTQEMALLRKTLQEWEEGVSQLPRGYFSIGEVEKRLLELENKAYTITDRIGKEGIEASFDEKLKGYQGKRTYLADIKGNYLRSLPGGTEAKSGEQVVLSISSELQEYAEQMLAECEQSAKKHEWFPQLQPWIKGGAIIAMDPVKGEIYALASYPRFDPNDFVTEKGGREKEKRKNVLRWLENTNYFRLIWDEKELHLRERFSIEKGIFYDEGIPLTFENYLNLILPMESPVKGVFQKRNRVTDALRLQELLEELFSLFLGEGEARYPETAKVLDHLYPTLPSKALFTLQEKRAFEEKEIENKTKVTAIKEALQPFFGTLNANDDKLLLVDLYRLVISIKHFHRSLIGYLGTDTLYDFRSASAHYAQIKDGIREIVKQLYVENDFRVWKEENFKTYLEAKREKEREEKRPPRSYLDYLDECEKERFEAFWDAIEKPLIACLLTNVAQRSPKMESYLQGVEKVLQTQKNLESFVALKKRVVSLPDTLLIDYLYALRTFDDLEEPLWGRYVGLRQEGSFQKGKDLACAFYPSAGYGYSRSSTFAEATTIGSIFKLVPAYAALIQRYEYLKEKKGSFSNLNPLTIIDDKHRSGGGREERWNVGYTADGKPIPMHYRGGKLPRSDHSNIGRVDLTHAIETSSNPYFSLLVGDFLDDPEDLCEAAKLFSFGAKTGIDLPGEIGGCLPSDISYNRSGLYAMAIGQHSLVVTPLQTAVMLAAIANGGKVLKPKISIKTKNELQETLLQTETKREAFLPKQVRSLLVKGMWQVIHGDKGTARQIRLSNRLNEEQKKEIKHVIGKTSTAEVMVKLSLDTEKGRALCKDVGFGAIAFKDELLTEPELVVVVFLRRGEYGWGAAPLAIKMISKWREIVTQHGAGD